MKIDVDAVARLQRLVREVGSQKAAAQQLGCSNPMVTDLLMGRRKFSDAMLEKLGLRRTVIEAKS